MSKLYVLKSIIDNKIIAITEYKYHLKVFILQNEYSKDDYTVKVYTDKNKIDKYLIKYGEDLYLTEYKNFIIRNNDKYFIEDLIYKYKKEIMNVIQGLEYINMNCIISPKDHTKIGEVINLIYNNTKKKNIDEFINIHSIIKEFCNNHNIKYNLQELNNRYQYNLLKEE